MEKIQTSQEWLQKYQEIKHLLTSSINYADYFDRKEIQGAEIFVLDMGKVTFPSGEILVRDPLVWLRREEKPYLQSVPKGTYRINLSSQVRRRSLQVCSNENPIYRSSASHLL